MLLGVILAVIGTILLLAAIVGIYEYVRKKEFGPALLALIFAVIPAIVTIAVGIGRLV